MKWTFLSSSAGVGTRPLTIARTWPPTTMLMKAEAAKAESVGEIWPATTARASTPATKSITGLALCSRLAVKISGNR